MATLLDLNIVSYIFPVVIFILIFTLTYGLLTKIKFLGSNNGLHALISFSLSLIIMLEAKSAKVLTLFIPWVFLLAVLVMFIFVIFMFMGLKEDYLLELVKNKGIIYIPILIGVIVLFFIALSNVFGPFFLVTDKPGFWETVKRVLFHPRVLGAIFMLAVAAYLVAAFEKMPAGK